MAGRGPSCHPSFDRRDAFRKDDKGTRSTLGLVTSLLPSEGRDMVVDEAFQNLADELEIIREVQANVAQRWQERIKKMEHVLLRGHAEKASL